MTSGAAWQRIGEEAAEPFGGVLSRAMLRELGADRNVVARQVANERWRVAGRNTVDVTRRPLGQLGLHWRAIWEVGTADVALDGLSSLQAVGMTGFSDRVVHVSVTSASRVRHVRGVRVHRLNRLDDEVVGPGPPRVRPAVAAVRAANWATSDRQAALLLALPVQQRLVPAQRLSSAYAEDRTKGRRRLVGRLVADIADGAQSLGELDFAQLCRRHGLPEPDRQALVRLPSGAVYLDVRWTAIGLVVEIDGSGHRDGVAVTEDNLRQNRVWLAGHRAILRFDLLALRLRPTEVMAQVAEAYATLSARESA